MANTRNSNTGGPAYERSPGGFGAGNTRRANNGRDATILDYCREDNEPKSRVKPVTLPGGVVYRNGRLEQS
jgi:hypothetical protein